MRTALARKPLPKPSPGADARFLKVMDQLKAGAARTKAHPSAARKAADAAAAAKGPPTERIAAGKARQVEKIKEAKEAKPEPSSFLAVLRAAIASAMPKTLGETEPEKFSAAAQQMKGGLKENVSVQKAASTKDVSSASKQTPTPTGEAKAEKPLPGEPAPRPVNVDAAEGMPAPKSDAEVSLQDSKQDVDQQMKEAEVTTPQLQKANDTRFSAAVGARQQVAQNADAGPAKYRAMESATLKGAAVAATSTMRVGAAAMIGVRQSGNVRVLTRQQMQKARDEAKRREVVERIEAIYNATKARVEAKLSAIDDEVNGTFDRGVEAALQSMTNFVNNRIRDYKIVRYLSIPLLGLAAWVRDQFMGLPEEVKVFYEQGRALFQAQMDALIVRVAALVEQRLREAKAEVAKGQAEIKAFVASQPAALRQVAQQAATDVNTRFQELERGIEEKKSSLAQSLAQKYKESFDKANESLKKIQDENKGYVQAFAEKLGEVIKALREFKDKLMAILRKGQAAIQIILADPIQFLKYLIAAVKGGIELFKEHFWEHLKRGFLQWLMGNMPPGVEIPGDLSLPSILKLVLGVLGITYEKMRAKAVKLIGERNVKIIEKVVEYIRALITGGPAALWEKVKEDLSNLKQMVIDAIQNWIVTTIVKQAITKIVSMFNPVGAIVQAILMIYNLVMFVVEQAQKILAFIEAVVNSLYDIATGAIGGAIKKVEEALARAVPIVIGLLARLLGLSGITAKVREFITKVQDRVDKAIDKVIAKIVETVKKVFGKVKAAAKALLEWWKRKVSFKADGETHTLSFQGDAKRASLQVSSEPVMSLRDFLAAARKNGKPEKTIGDIEKLQGEIDDLRAKRNPPTPDGEDPKTDPTINANFDRIATLLPTLFGGDKWGTETNPVLILEYPKKSASLYRTIYLGPRVNGRLSQDTLKDAASKKSGPKDPRFDLNAPIAPRADSLRRWIEKGGHVEEYRPFQRKAWPDGQTHGGDGNLGVEDRFLVQPGTTFKYDKGKTPGGKKLNEELKKFGFYGRKEGGENSDGDHILEAQLIGDRANVIGNMWPLLKTENRHGINLQQNAKAAVEKPKFSFPNLEEAVKSTDKRKAPKDLYIMIKMTKKT